MSYSGKAPVLTRFNSGRPEYHGQGVVYPGNYADPPMIELQLTGQADEHRNLFPSNAETSGRSLEQMAVAACLSAYCFARQFKRATGLPPHQYGLARRVEQVQQLPQRNRDRFLAEWAARAGFSDQSQFSHHFKRRVGVTPGQFRRSARNA